MTDNFLQKLEEKVMLLLTELEELRGELSAVKSENASLKSNQGTSEKKLQDLVSLLDSVEPPKESYNKVQNSREEMYA